MHTKVMKHLLSSFYIRLQCMILCWLLFTKRSILIFAMKNCPLTQVSSDETLSLQNSISKQLSGGTRPCKNGTSL